MKIKMDENVQAIICATQDYKKHVISYHNFVLNDHQFDWWEETKKFYSTLPLPDGMNSSAACFDAVLRYPIEDTLTTKMEGLPDKFTFGY